MDICSPPIRIVKIRKGINDFDLSMTGCMPISSPRLPKNSPKINPNIIAANELTIKIVPRSRTSSFFLHLHTTHIDHINAISPYPISPSIRPKKTGKKIAKRGDGSNVPYFGSARNRVNTSNGLTKRGLFRDTGIFSDSSAETDTTSTTTKFGNLSFNDFVKCLISLSGSHPYRKNVLFVP